MAKKQDPQIEWGFHAVIPRLVRTNYEKLTPVQKWLYVCLKDLCGEHGTCYRALRVLAEETGISTGMLSESIRCLHDAGLIHAEKKRRNNNPTAKEVWHITIVDIWQANAKVHPTKRSQNEHYKEENVHRMNNNVHTMNDIPSQCSPAEQQCSHSETEEVSLTSITIEAVSQSSNAIATSSEVALHTSNVSDIEAMRKRKTEPRMPALTIDTPSHIASSGYEKDGDEPTVKMKAVKIGANDGRNQHPSSTHSLYAGVDSLHTGNNRLHAEEDIREASIATPQKPDAGTRSLAADPPVGIQDDSASVQASSPGVGSSTPAQRSGSSLSGIPASPGAVQAGKRKGKVTQADEPVPMPKSDTREIQRRINEHRGYALEEKVDIVRERQAIKTWCNLHTLEEYGLVMSGAKNDKYWGKAENYYRIGGLTLLKITPEILARQRQPLPLAANGHNGHSNGNQDGLVYQGDLVLWNGQWMTEEEADKTGYNGGFGLYK